MCFHGGSFGFGVDSLGKVEFWDGGGFASGRIISVDEYTLTVPFYMDAARTPKTVRFWNGSAPQPGRSLVRPVGALSPPPSLSSSLF